MDRGPEREGGAQTTFSGAGTHREHAGLPGVPRVGAPPDAPFESSSDELRPSTEGVSPLVALAELPPRQRQTLALLLEGKREKEVASELGLSPLTVHQYVQGLYRRFGVSSRAELSARFLDRRRLVGHGAGDERASLHVRRTPPR
jgi:DNA-binding CsgD family transcriptional regulator